MLGLYQKWLVSLAKRTRSAATGWGSALPTLERRDPQLPLYSRYSDSGLLSRSFLRGNGVLVARHLVVLKAV